MTCKSVAEQLLDYLDGELTEADTRDFETHLGDCATCRALLATYKKTTSLCRKTLLAGVPKELEDRCLSFLRAKLFKK
jgi:anti-sigma factor RsiW